MQPNFKEMPDPLVVKQILLYIKNETLFDDTYSVEQTCWTV